MRRLISKRNMSYKLIIVLMCRESQKRKKSAERPVRIKVSMIPITPLLWTSNNSYKSNLTNSTTYCLQTCNHLLCLILNQLRQEIKLCSKGHSLPSKTQFAKLSIQLRSTRATSLSGNLSSPLRSSNSNSTCPSSIRCQKTKVI